MERNPEDLLRAKAKRAQIVVIVASYLLAFTWSIDAFFVWLFLGVAVYAEFLRRFYLRQTTSEEPRWERPVQGGGGGGLKITGVVPLIVGFGLFIVFLAVIIPNLRSSDSNPDVRELVNDTPPDDSSVGEKSYDDMPTNDRLNSLTETGNEFYNSGNYDSAAVYYDRVLTLDPNNQYGLYNKALVHYAKKEYYRPIPLLRRCLRDHPNYGEAAWLLGSVYDARSNRDSSRMWLNYAYAQGLRNGSFLQTLADQYKNEDKERAIELYKQSLEQDSSLADSYQQLIQLDPEHATEYKRMVSRQN